MGTVSVSASIGNLFAAAPSDTTGADAIQNVRESIPPEIGLVDGIVNWLTGFSPLNEWVIKPFAGDWTAIGHGAQAWATVGAAITTIEQTLATFPGEIGDSWQGQAATAWKSANSKVAASAQPLSGECTSMAAACDSAISFAQSIVTLVINIIYELIQRGEQIAEATSVPVIGEAIDAGEIAEFISEVINWAQQINAAIQSFTELVQSFEQVKASFSTSQSAAQQLASGLSKSYTSAAESLEDQLTNALGLGGAVMDDINKGLELKDKLSKKSSGDGSSDDSSEGGTSEGGSSDNSTSGGGTDDAGSGRSTASDPTPGASSEAPPAPSAPEAPDPTHISAPGASGEEGGFHLPHEEE